MVNKSSPSPKLKESSPASTEISCTESDSPTHNKQVQASIFIRKSDRIKFFLNVLSLIITAALVTKDAKYYAFYNVILISILLTHRAYEFYTKGWHFYLLDFCYFVNTIIIIHVLFFPKSEIMFFASFVLSIGPVLTAVPVYSCALSFHSTMKTTTLLIHSSPPLAMFLIHWHDKSKYFFSAATAGVQEFGPSLLMKWYGSVFLMTGVWVVFYYVAIFKVFRGYTTRNKLETLYDYMLSDPKTSDEIRSKEEKWRPFMFMWIYIRFVLIFITLSGIFYYSYWIGLVWVIINHLIGVYNGATYYINFHSERYEKTLLDLDEEEEEKRSLENSAE